MQHVFEHEVNRQPRYSAKLESSNPVLLYTVQLYTKVCIICGLYALTLEAAISACYQVFG